MARRTVETLIEVAEQPFESSVELFDRLVDAGRKLAESRPGVGAIAGAAGRVLAAANAHRFLDPDASPEVIAQKLTQCGMHISTRSVERIIERFGLQKKTPPLQAEPPA